MKQLKHDIQQKNLHFICKIIQYVLINHTQCVNVFNHWFINNNCVFFTEHCQPVSVVKSLLPCWNSLVFFEVSPLSFHQVVTKSVVLV